MSEFCFLSVSLEQMDIKFGVILSICSKEIERKQNPDKSRAINNTVTNMQKSNNTNVDLVNMNACSPNLYMHLY